MAASKSTILFVFVLYFSCIFLARLSGIEAHYSCKRAKDCEVLCQGKVDGCVDNKCVCEWRKTETELTKTIRCKTDSDCPDSRECPKDYYYSCLHGECTCIAV
ncbi:unnamed protein product [Cochlearia groenlandica]